MRRAVLIACLVACQALTACSKPAPPPPPPAAPPPAPAYDPWPGRYEGDLMARISPIHRVTLVTARDGCTGDAGLAGGEPSQPVGADHLRVTLTARTTGATTGAVCTVDLTRNGDRLTVSESGDCAAWHGPACPFTGAATRVR